MLPCCIVHDSVFKKLKSPNQNVGVFQIALKMSDLKGNSLILRIET